MDLIKKSVIREKIEILKKSFHSKNHSVYSAGVIGTLNELSTLLDETAPIDAQPVIHAKWIGEVVFDGDTRYAHASIECSNCHKVRTIDNFCSNCVAKMDLE